MVDNDLAHRIGRSRKEMRPAMPLDTFGIHQPETGLVDQCRVLERNVTRAYVAEPARQPP